MDINTLLKQIHISKLTEWFALESNTRTILARQVNKPHYRLTKHVLKKANINELSHAVINYHLANPKDNRFIRAMVREEYKAEFIATMTTSPDMHPLEAIIRIDPLYRHLILSTYQQVKKLIYMVMVDPIFWEGDIKALLADDTPQCMVENGRLYSVNIFTYDQIVYRWHRGERLRLMNNELYMLEWYYTPDRLREIAAHQGVWF